MLSLEVGCCLLPLNLQSCFWEAVLGRRYHFTYLIHVPRILELIRMTHVVFDAYLGGKETGVEVCGDTMPASA
jgi:hypothetical protein